MNNIYTTGRTHSTNQEIRLIPLLNHLHEIAKNSGVGQFKFGTANLFYPKKIKEKFLITIMLTICYLMSRN